jgi:hypothetical protein
MQSHSDGAIVAVGATRRQRRCRNFGSAVGTTPISREMCRTYGTPKTIFALNGGLAPAATNVSSLRDWSVQRSVLVGFENHKYTD